MYYYRLGTSKYATKVGNHFLLTFTALAEGTKFSRIEYTLDHRKLTFINSNREYGH